MNENKSIAAQSALYAVIAGAVVCFALYFLSSWFFEAKQNQTLVKSAELGNSSKGDLVFPVGSKVPNVEFEEMVTGSEYVLAKDPAPIRIVNFWASWCEPCVEEFSSFSRLIKQFQGEISFVGINEDKTEAEAREFLKAFKADFKGLSGVYFGYDKEKFYSKQYGILALPESFLIDGEGKLIRRVSGYESWDSPGAIAYFKSLLEKAKVK